MNFNEQKNRIKESGYKYIAPFRGNDQICAWNMAGKIDAKFEEIETRLQNNTAGLYTIKARNATKEKSQDLFNINTGSQKLAEPGPQIIYKEPASDKLLENQQILNLTVQVKQLEMENKYLKDQITDLETEIAELETAAAVTLS